MTPSAHRRALPHGLITTARQRLTRLRDFLRNPEALEFACVLIALLLLLPLYLQLPGLLESGDGRFAPNPLQEVQLPPPVLPAICRHFGGQASFETAAACVADGKPLLPLGDETPGEQLPIELLDKARNIGAAFAAPLKQPQERLDKDRFLLRQGKAEGSLEDKQEELNLAEEKLRPYLLAYALLNDGKLAAGPEPMQCLMDMLAGPAWRQASSSEARAGLAIWLAGALDGKTDGEGKISLATLDNNAYLALDRAWQRKGHCQAYFSPKAVAEEVSRIVALGRTNESAAHKSAAMRHLLPHAWWQWPLMAMLGYLFLRLSRRAIMPLPATGMALLAWGAAGWVTQVYLPFSQDINRAWSIPQPIPLPPWPISLMMLVGLLLWLLGRALLRRRRPRSRPIIAQEPASRFGYAGLVFFTGIGFLLLLDLSATGHLRNRYLGLYQQGYLWGAMLLLTLTSLWRQRLASRATRILASGNWTGMLLAGFLVVLVFRLYQQGYLWAAMLLLTLTSLWRQRLAYWFTRILAGRNWTGMLLGGFLVVLAFLVLRHHRQFTSELGRLWLIIGAAWFFYLRGDLAFNRHNLATGGGCWLLRFVSPLLFVVTVLGLAMLVTDDMGPLLISVYGGGIFVSASLAYALYRYGWRLSRAWVVGILVLAMWLFGVTESLFVIGKYHPTTAGRLESMANPLISTNDQMALITWFRQNTPNSGYSVGNIPWCGQAASGSCHGVPLQIHSDYTFSALWGLFGRWITSVVMTFAAYWLYHLAKKHPRVTRGIPAGRPGTDGSSVPDTQAFLSWVCVTWLTLTICQLAVTVAGNLRALPLTGVTFPFVSYGMTSLWVNCIFLGLCLNVDKSGKRSHE